MSTNLRRHKRYFLDKEDSYNVSIEISKHGHQSASIHDISASGMCLIADIQTFLQAKRAYTFKILNDQNEVILRPVGKIIWHMRRDNDGQDSIFYGIQFDEPIEIPENIKAISDSYEKKLD